MKNDESIGDRIRATRVNKGMTQQQVADSIGVTYQNISQYERGLRKPKNETLIQIADALGVSVYELIGFNGANTDDVPLAVLQQQIQQHKQSDLPSNVRPISALHHQHVPMIGSVAAGEPIYDPEELGVYVETPVDADAAITIRGDSMVPTYQDGDVVYIKCRPDVPEGAVAVVFLDDEATLKHVYKRPTGLTLISDNMETHPPIMVEFEDYANVRIFGVPVGYTRIYKPTLDGKIRKGFK
jgi:repressor LexA